MRHCCHATVLMLVLTSAAIADPNTDARQIIEKTNVQGGFVVHLGATDGQMTSALRANERYQVHGLATTPAAVSTARKAIQTQGIYGPVAVDLLAGNRLPYVDNMVNLLVAADLGAIPMEEVTRVLTPNGKAVIGTGETQQVVTKPVPDNIDDWTHFLHDASGNAVADDDVVGPPRHLQWVGSPRWSRHHDRMASMSALVSAAGRLYYIMDEGSRISIQMPPKWTLVARDAFNGVVLWKQPISSWHNHLWPLKSGPTQLARRLVAEGDNVFVTLGLYEPLTLIHGPTGKVVQTYEGTKTTEEIIHKNGKLFLLVNTGPSDTQDYEVKLNLGDQARVRTEFKWNEQARAVVGIDAKSGRVMWRKETTIAPLTLSADDERVYFHDGEKVVVLQQSTGDVVWSSEPIARRPVMTINFGPKMAIVDGILLFAGGDRQMRAYDAASGKVLWSAPHARGGYQSPEDLLVSGGLVWSAPTTSGKDSGIWTGRVLKTGEVKSEFPPNVETYWFHHRCYIAKATNKYLLPSRTGIEFVDYAKKDWEIHHWVRGGCLYGVMPCNGLLYAPPHNCACYPEAKLYGLNALAPASPGRRPPAEIPEAGRLERGPGYGANGAGNANPNLPGDTWPTYRHDKGRSGYSKTAVSTRLQPSWTTKLGGRLTAPVAAEGMVFVAQKDQHTLHALDVTSGDAKWSYTIGARIDSPPTVHRGRVIFGGCDGWVYCLWAHSGQLVWRYRVAPRDERMLAFEQLESVWPVHGSVLIENDTIYCVAGRSNFLDGGLRMVRLNINTGEKISESLIDEKDPETGKNIQERLQVLQMPVGLPDILSSDGRYIYMRSQQFDQQCQRLAIGPHSGDFAGQGSVQKGETAHLFAPMGFLDDTYFHRAYWVYGRSFAGGHAGYYQAGKFAPAGRLLVTNGEDVFGFGRKPQYLKWTTTIEHQLFSASTEHPEEARETAEDALARRRGNNVTMVQFKRTKSLNPANQALAIEAWVKTAKPTGVVVARGGPAEGFALTVAKGKPQFMIRAGEALSAIGGKQAIGGKWVHLCGVLGKDKSMRLYVDGKLAAQGKAKSLITSDPQQAMEIGADDAGAVGNYKSPFPLTGMVDEVRLHFGEISPNDVNTLMLNPGKAVNLPAAKTVLACSFDHGRAEDKSENGNAGEVIAATAVDGKFGGAMQFAARGGGRSGGSAVKPNWTADIPLYARAMVLTDKTLFVCGPPDLIDEEQTFQRLVSRDPKVQALLERQQSALDGGQGSVLRAVSAVDGTVVKEWQLPSLPIWDAIAAAHGRLLIATVNGEIICMGSE